jgi:hypothetical protein
LLTPLAVGVRFVPIPARSSSPLSVAKERARRAHKAARGCDPRSAALYDRWLATTFSAAGGKDEALAIAMFTRIAIALEVMVDMKGWPAGNVAGVTA